jgi:hypothetical protein
VVHQANKVRRGIVKLNWTLSIMIALPLALAGCKSGDKRDSDPTGPTVNPPAPPVKAPAATFTMSRDGLPEVGSWKSDPQFGDVNHDGMLDLVAHIRLDYGPAVWLGDGRGGWRGSLEGLRFEKTSCGGGVRFADLNGDGHLDMAVADHCQGVYAYLGDGTGKWKMTTRARVPQEAIPPDASSDELHMHYGAECLDVGDVNEDGHLDLLVGASDTGGLHLYLGDGTAANWVWRDPGVATNGRWAMRVRLYDLNGDGRLDIVANCMEGPRVWYAADVMKWESGSAGLPSPSYGGIYHGLALGDVNEDGRTDLVTANWIDGPEVYLQRADGSWEKQPDVFPEMLGGSSGIAVGDIDRDGHLDIVTSGRLTREVGYVYGVYFLRGDGVGGWHFERDSGLPTVGLPYMWGVALGDVNGDGILDVAAGSGGAVATNPKYSEPVLRGGMFLWETDLPKK